MNPALIAPATRALSSSRPEAPLSSDAAVGEAGKAMGGSESPSSSAPSFPREAFRVMDPADFALTTEDLNDAAQRILDRTLQLCESLDALQPVMFHAPSPRPRIHDYQVDLFTIVSSTVPIDGSIDEPVRLGLASYSLPVALLHQPTGVDWTLRMLEACICSQSGASNSRDQLVRFAMVQLRVEEHERQQQMPQLTCCVKKWRLGGPEMWSDQLNFACILWCHATFDRWDPSDVSASTASDAFVLLCAQLRPAHALHLLSSLDDSVLLRLPQPPEEDISRINRAGRLCHELAVRFRKILAHIRTDEGNVAAAATFRRWIASMQLLMAPHLVASAALNAPCSLSSCHSFLAPAIDDPLAPLYLDDRGSCGGAKTLMACIISDAQRADDAQGARQNAPDALNPLLPLIARLEQRTRGQSDQELERDGAFTAVVDVLRQSSLTPETPAHSLVDYLLSRLRNRLLASGSRLCVSPTFRWPRLFDAFFTPSDARVCYPVVFRLLSAHGLTVCSLGVDLRCASLEDVRFPHDAASELWSDACDDITMAQVDWIAPAGLAPVERSHHPLMSAAWVDEPAGELPERPFEQPRQVEATQQPAFRPAASSDALPSLPECDLIRRMDTIVPQSGVLLLRLALLETAAARWYHRCFPRLRAEIESHLIPDLASIVLSYVTTDEKVLISLPRKRATLPSATAGLFGSSVGFGAVASPSAFGAPFFAVGGSTFGSGFSVPSVPSFAPAVGGCGTSSQQPPQFGFGSSTFGAATAPQPAFGAGPGFGFGSGFGSARTVSAAPLPTFALPGNAAPGIAVQGAAAAAPAFSSNGFGSSVQPAPAGSASGAAAPFNSFAFGARDSSDDESEDEGVEISACASAPAVAAPPAFGAFHFGAAAAPVLFSTAAASLPSTQMTAPAAAAAPWTGFGFSAPAGPITASAAVPTDSLNAAAAVDGLTASPPADVDAASVSSARSSARN